MEASFFKKVESHDYGKCLSYELVRFRMAVYCTIGFFSSRVLQAIKKHNLAWTGINKFFW